MGRKNLRKFRTDMYRQRTPVFLRSAMRRRSGRSRNARNVSLTMEALLFPGFFLLLCVLCGALALIDLRHGIIPNGLNLAIAALGLARAIVADGTMAGGGGIRDAT